MERRGRIPVAKFRTQEAKTRSRSRVKEPDYNEQDPEHDMFTLLEDNIALKEENKALKLEIESYKTTQEEQQAQHEKLCTQLEQLQQQQIKFESNIKDLTVKFNKTLNERNALDKLHKMKVDQINSLTSELEHMREKQLERSGGNPSVLCSTELKRKLLKILQNDSTDSGEVTNDLDSLIDVDANLDMPITTAQVERLVSEFSTLKHATNAVELQLYEANEKIAELVEHQHLLEEENETLRTENGNLTKVAKLLTDNMKESVETSQKMEAALIRLKQRNDELAAKVRDQPDGQLQQTPSPTTLQSQAEFEEITDRVQHQAREHNERIVEMKNLMDAAIAKTTNEELKKLQLKLEILEEQLRLAQARADQAEEQLERYQQAEKHGAVAKATPPAPTPPPPPPPPPMPPKMLYKASTTLAGSAAADGEGSAGSFSQHIAGHNLHKGHADKIIDNVKQQVEAQAATGLDAIVREFKSGRVTLRRNRRKTNTSAALKEMFQVLEISQKQNRNSKICVDLNTSIPD